MDPFLRMSTMESWPVTLTASPGAKLTVEWGVHSNLGVPAVVIFTVPERS